MFPPVDSDHGPSLPPSDVPNALPLGMPATRKLSAHDLGLVTLALLDAEKSYGSQLGDRIEALSNGFYRPSPGMLYPVLGRLAEQGLITQQREGRRKYYSLTREGSTYLTEHHASAQQVRSRLDSAGRKLNALFADLRHSLADETQAMPLAQELLTARMDMKAALHESRGASPEAQRRILQLLQETIARIRHEARE
ncbi:MULTISPECIES: PadR family transcriptional regulator [Cobetia]|uniref:PadR family transcriptional regulator n=1 Tax=Cobetia TaxID=204286 RepID=UPI00178C9F03|nr:MULTISPECIES: PadR family transcriptional regulator [Cobetia]MBE2167467.1 PadR family transcriptional regulator [Cobetia sp. 2AS1]MDH2421731.1 PadR family transcriptional regulator [Cobetia litoralis]MDH2447088.1 PadR family transcriptional regulator [Cobetia sp. 2AS]